MTYTQQLPPPAYYKAYTFVAIDGRFAVASVQRPGIGFTVKSSQTIPGCVQLAATATDKSVVLQVHVDGLPALIAALQDCLPTENDR